MIIDAHVHIGRTEKSDRSFDFFAYKKFMKNVGIDKAVVMPNISSIDTTFNLNDKFLFEYNKFKSDNIFYPFILIDPNRVDILNQLEHFSQFIYGVKYHPSICRVVSDHPLMDKFYKWLEVNQKPIIIHCGRDGKSSIQYIILAAKKYPKVNFIAAHLGGNTTDLIEKAIKLLTIEKLNNIYLDTSAGKLPWLIEQAVLKLGSDKIIFGSDEPYADLRIGKYCVDLANIKGKKEIFSYNINKLLKVKI